MLKIINQIITFIIELTMLGSFVYYGFHLGNTTLIKYASAIALPSLAIVLWSYWVAPKSGHRLRMPYLVLFRLFLFLLASFLLYLCKQPTLAVILALFSMITQITSLFLERNENR